jgi:sigma-54 dependent transcriptional regulator, flagellar regulatory protein
LEDVVKTVQQDSFKTAARADLAASRHYITGDSDAAHALRQMAALGASCDVPLLISGPYDSGKEHVARYIHAESGRRHRPFFKLNCGQDNLSSKVGSDHAQNASDGGGSIESIEGGTLFLSNADEMSIDVQTLVFQLIEQRSMPAENSHIRQPLNIRIIAASSHCLASMVSAGTFRQDLYDRLKTLSLPVPPLRQRREDIVPLMQKMLLDRDVGERFNIDWAAGQALRSHNWPGNSRELNNLVAHGCIIYAGQTIGERQIDSLLTIGQPARAGHIKQVAELRASRPLNNGFNLKSHLEAEELQFLTTALRQVNGVVQHAADLTGLKRTTFIEKMRKHGIDGRHFKR